MNNSNSFQHVCSVLWYRIHEGIICTSGLPGLDAKQAVGHLQGLVALYSIRSGP